MWPRPKQDDTAGTFRKENREFEGGGGLMELNQVHLMTSVGLAEHVTSATDYRIQFLSNHEDSKPEKVSLTHQAKHFQRQVRMEDVTQ